MGTQSEWVYSDLDSPKVVKAAHKIPLVSPRMDVDVTGVSLKNVRTHLIDHPRDDGLKHREQLWNFQQKFRGVVGKARQSVFPVGDDRKCETSGSDEPSEDDCRQVESVRVRVATDHSSLPSRFRKRLKHKINFTGVKSSDFPLDSDRRRSIPLKDLKEEEKPNHGIQRLYSSGLIVKNNLYNQLRNGGNGDEKRSEQLPDNSRILEAIQKYGSLEKLPDITYPGIRSAQSPNIRFLRTFHSYHRRMLVEKATERRYLPLRRSFTNFSDLGSSKRKLIIVSRRGQNDDRIVRLGCIDTYNENDNEEDEDNNDDDDDVDDEEVEDEDDECDNENQILHAEKLHGRMCDLKRPEHIDIRNNITQVNTQDDMVLIERHKHEEDDHQKELRSEKTFHAETRKPHVSKEYRRTDLSGQERFEPRCNSKVRDSWNNTKVGTKDKDGSKDTKSNKRSQKKKNDVDSKDDEMESDESLDIPDHKFGPTTHSIDKKLSIRKPWEWKPSPYRWIDRPYVKESDKPYIERIINTGEIIDEFHYDSFARTKPLKLQNFPDGAGYKDRYGNLR